MISYLISFYENQEWLTRPINETSSELICEVPVGTCKELLRLDIL